jgi:hypothetical protein
MKQNSAYGFHKRKAFARRQRDQLVDSVKAGDDRNQFAMRVMWLILGTACAALAWVLITILVR